MRCTTTCHGLGLLAVIALLSHVSVVAAQEPPGTLSGIVSARDGARLPLAVIRLTGVGTGTTVNTTTGTLGTYRIAPLVPGVYELAVEAPGFAPSRLTNLFIPSGQNVSLDVVLDVAAVVESLVVSARARDAGLEAGEIREIGDKDVGEALSRQAGLTKLRKAAIANDVVVRGLQSRDLNVLVDGERIYGACPNRMDPPAFHVDFAEVERVEVAKGPMDVRHQGSLGGFVNVVTRAPALGWHAQPSLVVGSFGYVNPAVTASYGDSRVALLAGASYRESEPYDDGNGDSFLAPANYQAAALETEAFSAATAWARAVWTPADGHRLQAAYTRQAADVILYPYLQMDAVYDDADRASVRYERPSVGGLVSGVRANGYWTRVKHWMTDEQRITALNMPRTYSMGTMAETATYGGTVEGAVGGVTIGFEGYRREWNASTQLAGAKYAPQASIPGVVTDSYGVFAEYTRAVHPRASIDVGGRIDHLRTTADDTVANTSLYYAYHGTRDTGRTDVLAGGKARVTWQVAPRVDLTGGLGHTARTADATERFFALKRMGSDWVGNPQLDPARNTGLDVGLTWRLPGVSISANAFANWIDGYVTIYDQARVNAVPGVMNTRARSYGNVDAALQGAEVRAEAVVFTRLFLSADVNLLRGSQTPNASLGLSSTVLAETPPTLGRVRVRFDQGMLFVAAEATLAAEQDRVNTDLDERPTPGYKLLDVRGGVRYRWLTASLGVTNLFDRAYSEHLSYYRDPFRLGVRVNEPGRSVFANVSARF